ncbi:P-loop containing nucleoside triphosphate hydrolase protein [Aspergillus heterothallicus]
MSDSSDTLLDFYNGVVSSSASSSNTASSSKKAEPSSARTDSFNSCFKDVTELRGSPGSRGEVYATGSSATRDAINNRKFANYSLLLRRIEFQDRTSRPRAQLEIQSHVLCEAVRELASRFSYLPLHKHPIIIEAPYWELYHCYDDILRLHETTTSQTLAADLGLLLDFHKRFVSQTAAEIASMVAMGKITFQHLWALFPPGELVILQNELGGKEPVLSCATVDRYELVEGQSGLLWCLSVKHSSLDYLQNKKVIDMHTFQDFTGALDITSLPAFPIKCHPDKDGLRSSMIARARNYIKLHQASRIHVSEGLGAHFQHKGSFWIPIQPRESRKGCTYFEAPSSHISGRFIVDPESMVEEMPIFTDKYLPEKKKSSTPSSNRRGMTFQATAHLQTVKIRSRAESPSSDPSMLSDEDLVTFPARAQGYSLSDKAWGYVLIENLNEIAWEENAFEKLQIHPNHKDMVRKLVASHRTSNDGFDDVIRGKGLGLVFLLEGPPGSGKTMTAEVVAECLHSPLYTVTSGELGSSITDVERNLKNAFKLITKWNAVMLLDEADVFMTKRSKENSMGNELVSIFLRLVEYQTGVLFLTTNRTDNLDPAFASRIHVHIPYSSAGPEQRKLIWEQLADKMDHALTVEDIAVFSELELSGREIKNILRVASLHAGCSSSAGKLARCDIERALEYAFRRPPPQCSQECT